MRRSALLLLFSAALGACAAPQAQTRQARNVILFIGDAGGIPTLSAASIHGYGAPRKLFVQSMPNIALSETSTASQWVTDSAAGMTAIMTGKKTHNGVISQSDAAVRNTRDGAPLKTLLEDAEERGLATGVITNSPVLDATPAATYAHVNDRGKAREIFAQFLAPRFGDGVDVLIGGGRQEVVTKAADGEQSAAAALQKAGYRFADALAAIPESSRRFVVLPAGELDLGASVRRAIATLSANPRGYFLMVESDLHTENIRRGLDRAVALDTVIRDTVRAAGDDTLIIFTADHSYDFRVHDGLKGTPLLPADLPAATTSEQTVRLEAIRRDDDHTGEEVMVAATGPGADAVHGVLSNVDLFDIMRRAYGWR